MDTKVLAKAVKVAGTDLQAEFKPQAQRRKIRFATAEQVARARGSTLKAFDRVFKILATK
jgi:hypothetical protein